MYDRLVELIKRAEDIHLQMALSSTIDELIDLPNKEETIADHLLANDVIVPPCKVGDTVYLVEYSHLTGDGYVLKNHVEAFTVEDDLVYVYCSNSLGRLIKRLPGVSAFFTHEEAEAALKGGVG